MHIDIHALISHYGYLALLIGCMAEGETFVLLGGIAAHEGLLNFFGVLGAAMVGGIIGDQILYWLGRRYGTRIVNRFENQKDKVEKATRLIHRHPALFVIGTRFMYGFRIIGPIIIGSSGLRPWLFVALNVVGAFIWATIFVSLGYFAGKVITPWMDKLEGYLGPIFWTVGGIILLVALWKLFTFLRNQKRQQQ